MPTAQRTFWFYLAFLMYTGGVFNAYCQDTTAIDSSFHVRKIRTYEKTFQFSMFPGISTNGISSASYFNKFSLNAFGGLSAGTRIFEIGLITNLTTFGTTGIQLAGLANITGTNAFMNLTSSEEKALINDGLELNGKGIQVAGLLNYVRDNSYGIQLAGLMNVVGRDFRGTQFSLIGNSAGGDTDGIQLSGIYNIAHESMAGIQLGSLNYTNGQLTGIQIGLFNKAKRIKGKKSTPITAARGMQIGLVNFSKSMDGLQIGLVNFGGRIRGKQIGLLNFFMKYPSKEYTRNGTPIGILNFGSKGSYYRLFFNELYSVNLEYTTGNCLNCSYTQAEMPFEDRNKIYNQNAIIVGFEPAQNTWGFGYGFQKVLYNKASMLPTNKDNEKRMMSYGIKFMHLNRDMNLDKAFNLLTRLNFDYGKRWHSMYVFAGVSLNYFLQPLESGDIYKIRSVKISTGEAFGLDSFIWPGYSVGIQF